MDSMCKEYILSPSWGEFVNFNKFIEKHEALIEKYGFILVNAPEMYKDLVVSKEKQRKLNRMSFSPQMFEFEENENGTGFSVSRKKLNFQEKPDAFKARCDHEYPPPSVNDFKTFVKALPFRKAEYIVDLDVNLFPDNLKVWNLSNLGDMFSTRQKKIETIPGLTTPYVYIGAYGAPFALHCEDMNLGSINFLHVGASKEWLVFPAREKDKVHKLYKKIASHYTCQYDALDCHKVAFVPPDSPLIKDVAKTQVTQHEGQFMIIGPAAYHQGFNKGNYVGLATSKDNGRVEAKDCVTVSV